MRKNNGNEPFEVGIGAYVGEDIKAVFAWHFEIEQDEARQGEQATISKGRPAMEVIENFVPIGEEARFDGQPGFGQRSFAEPDIVRIIFGNEHKKDETVSRRKREIARICTRVFTP